MKTTLTLLHKCILHLTNFLNTSTAQYNLNKIINEKDTNN